MSFSGKIEIPSDVKYEFETVSTLASSTTHEVGPRRGKGGKKEASSSTLSSSSAPAPKKKEPKGRAISRIDHERVACSSPIVAPASTTCGTTGSDSAAASTSFSTTRHSGSGESSSSDSSSSSSVSHAHHREHGHKHHHHHRHGHNHKHHVHGKDAKLAPINELAKVDPKLAPQIVRTACVCGRADESIVLKCLVTPLSNLLDMISSSPTVEFKFRRKNKTCTMQWHMFQGTITNNGAAYLSLAQTITNMPDSPMESPIRIIYNGVAQIGFVEINPESPHQIRFYFNISGTGADTKSQDSVIVLGGSLTWIAKE
jgi:hypothetical protein